MKTKEFIRKIENLGFEIEKGFSQFVITSPFDTWVAVVDRKEICQINNNYSEWGLLNDPSKKELFDIISEYAKTPIEDRKEEKKFYLKHRWIKGCVIMYLYRNTLNGYCYLGDKKCRPHRQKMFTLKEIEEIKEKYNTDLKDFEMIEVEE